MHGNGLLEGQQGGYLSSESQPVIQTKVRFVAGKSNGTPQARECEGCMWSH